MAWQGDAARFAQICQLFELGSSPDNNVQQQAFQQLNLFSQMADFDMYLVTILANMTNQHEVVRQRAGLLLKENLRRNASNLSPPMAEFIQSAALVAVRDQNRSIRHTAGTVLTTIVQRVGVQSCLQTLDQLAECLGDPHADIAEGCFNALNKVCEDGVSTLETNSWDGPKPETLPFVNWCTTRLLPRVFEYTSPRASAVVRFNAIECLNHFALNHLLTADDYPTFLPFASRYVEVLGILANDTDVKVMREVCKGFVCVVENNWVCLRPEQCQAVLQYMLKAAQHPEYDVRLEALEVWSPCMSSPVLQQMVAQMLSELVPVLLANMVYTDADYMGMEQAQIDDDNAAVPDQQGDIKPRFHKDKGVDDEEAEEAGTWGADWTARKAAASSLDHIASSFQANFLPVILPLIEQKLQDSSWEVQESGVFALGAIAYGCMEGLASFLPKVMELLLRLCQGQQPLLRSISCWCAARFSQWICHAQNPMSKEVLPAVLDALLKRCLDRNKRVQEAACSALATLQEEARSALVPFLPQIVQTLVEAFRYYQAKNLLILYDAVGTLADAVRRDLAQPRLVEALMTPIMEKFNNTPDNDRSLVALFECLSSLAISIGPAILPVASRIAIRCEQHIITGTRAAQMWQQNPNEFEKPDRETTAASIDLLSGLIDGLGNEVKQVLHQHNFLCVIQECLKDPSLQVKQTGFALMGDSAKRCCEYLTPFLPELIPLCAKSLRDDTSATVSNNASWAIGEVCVKVGPEVMAPYLELVVAPLTSVLARPPNQTLLVQNVCITLGRLGLVCGDQMSKPFALFARTWCLVMRVLPTDDEKITAFQGLCNLIKCNPQACMTCVPELAGAVASVIPAPPVLQSSFREIMQNYKQAHGNGWPAVYAQFPDGVKTVMHTTYGLS